VADERLEEGATVLIIGQEPGEALTLKVKAIGGVGGSHE
jgi:hypothetical protein